MPGTPAIPIASSLPIRKTRKEESHRASHGREEIRAFLRRKWAKENGYRLKKELWGFRENRMAVRFEYEWHDESGQWYRAYGNEMWEFNPKGLMARRFASINDAPIREDERRIR